MKNLSRFVLLAVLLALLAVPVMAQEGEGGVIIEDNIGDDPATFNPLLGNDTGSSDIYRWLYPDIVGIDFDTGQIAPNQPQSLATGWEYDETGTVLTVTLREDAFWSDGVQITSADYLWAVNAIWSGTTSSPRTSMFAELKDGTPAGGKIIDVQAPDDFTVVITFSEADCVALGDIDDAAVVPAHEFDAAFGDDYAAMDDDPRRLPQAVFGPFHDVEFEPGARVSLLANQTYPDTSMGYISPSEWVYLSTGGSDATVERFREGDITYTGIPSNYQEDFRDDPNFQIHEYNNNGFSYLAFNMANPENPLPGLDEDGNLVEQDPHPIFGDVRVRLALTYALDIEGIIEGLYGGNGTRIGTHTIPQSWTFNPDLQHPFDKEAAAELLDEAGWVVEDGAEWRVCRGCAYTEVDPDFEGTEMVFDVTANEGNDIRERMAEFATSEWNELGAGAQYQTLDWGSAFIPALVGQTFDIVTLGWSLGLPDDGDMLWAYGPEADLPGSGFNFVSFYDQEFIDVQNSARDPLQTDGCDQEVRRGLISRAQEILFEQQPYIYLLNPNVMFALQPEVEGFDPKAYSRIWNIDAWTAND